MGNNNGHNYARFWLVVALIVSVTANITHAVLAVSDVSLWLRVPGAVVWPMFTFAGIEVLVRVYWEKRWTHNLTRTMLLAASVPAAITSYEHQFTLLGMMGETSVIQFIGPLAIDGLMIGCTMTVLLTRKRPAQETPAENPLHEKGGPVGSEPINLGLRLEAAAREVVPAHARRDSVVISGAVRKGRLEAAAREIVPARARKDSGVIGEAVRLILEEMPGMSVADIKDKTGVSVATIRLYMKIARLLRNDPRADIGPKVDGRSVRSDLVAVIRDHMNRARVR